MVNFDGQLLPVNSFYLNHTNRGLRYGDALFETMKWARGQILFWEDHYMRLMASMRILRMEIPMAFTMEFLGEEISRSLKSGSLDTGAARVRLTVFRKGGGYYLPSTNDISYIIETSFLAHDSYLLSLEPYEISLFKDFTINAGLLATLKTADKLIQVVGSIFASENGYRNCVLLNQEKHVVEALNGNIFLVKEGIIKTPPVEDGCVNGIMRKQLCHIIPRMEKLQLAESPITSFDLQDAEEVFITNVITGIQPVTHYRKAAFGHTVTGEIFRRLNDSLG